MEEGGFHEARYTYDDRGHIAERRFLDVAGHESNGPNGFSIEAIDHDAFGRPIRFHPTRSDDEDDPLYVEIGYDVRGNAILVEYRNHTDQLADGKQNFARANIGYDRFGEYASVEYFNAAGQPVNQEETEPSDAMA